MFHSTDARRACRRGAIGSTMGAYPRDTGSNPVEGNGHFFPSYRQLYLSSFFDTHTHTHAHISTDAGRACPRGVIGSTVGAYPRGTGLNLVERNGHFFPSCRQLYLSSFSDTHTHTHTLSFIFLSHTHTHTRVRACAPGTFFIVTHTQSPTTHYSPSMPRRFPVVVVIHYNVHFLS